MAEEKPTKKIENGALKGYQNFGLLREEKAYQQPKKGKGFANREELEALVGGKRSIE